MMTSANNSLKSTKVNHRQELI